MAVTFKTRYRGRDVDFPSKSIDRAAASLSPKNIARLTQIAEMEMRKYLTRVADALISRHSRPWSPGYRGPDLQRRSGKGLRSIRNFVVLKTGEQVTGHMRLNHYMTVQEHGAIIRPRNAKYLAIPLPAALNSNGTPRKTGPREWRNTFIAKSRAGNLIIFLKTGRDIVPLYVLKKRVRLPARLGLRSEMRAQRPRFRLNIIEEIRQLRKRGR